jgi:ferrous iron transport protein B
VEGVWSGVGSVMVFLPQVLLLFLFIGILEDSGYLARAALIADRTMAGSGCKANRSSRCSRLTPARCRRSLHPHHRKQARPHRHHPDRALHDVLGAPPRLHADHRAFLAQPQLLGFLSVRTVAMIGLYALGFLVPPC